MEDKRTKVTLKQTQLFRLGDLLRKHCSSVDGFAVYADGWSDEQIVEALKGEFAITVNNVAGLRKTLLGKFPPSTETGGSCSSAALLRRIEALEKWASERPVQPFKREG